MIRHLKLESLGRFRDVGLLIMRVGIGISFMVHGKGKLFDPAMWPKVGGAMANLGITFAPAFWGFMAAFAEFGGGLLLVLGLCFRPAAAMMAFTMLVATITHLRMGDGFGDYSHAMELGIFFLGMILVGPGRLSLDRE